MYLCVYAVIPGTCQQRLLRCKPYMCLMIAWFGPLEGQVEEGLFYSHLFAKHLFGKRPDNHLSW
jgi:hypothetical protein